MKKAEFINRYGQEAYEQVLLKQREYNKTHKEEIKNYNNEYRKTHKEEIKGYMKDYWEGYGSSIRGGKPKWDFYGCTTSYDRMKKMNLFVEYSAEKDELMPKISGKIDIFQIGDCRDRIYLTVSIVNGRPVVWAFDKESGKQYPIKVHEIVYFAEHGGIDDGWVIHHIDGNPLNNHPHNLVAMPRGEHVRYHKLKDRTKAEETLDYYIRLRDMKHQPARFAK